MHYSLPVLCGILALASCAPSHPSVPSEYASCDTLPHLYPDYADVVLPPNIAPLNFAVDEAEVDEVVARLVYPGGSQTFGEDNKVLIDLQEWKEIVRASVGQSIQVELYAHKAGQWTRYRDFFWQVAADSIDPYIAYRQLPVTTYQTFGKFSIRQRCLETFDECDIYNNQMLDTPTTGHCINCHSFQNYRTDRMQMHVRVEHAGTVFYDQGKLHKVNLKTPVTVNAGVYPAWHPSLDLIAYSVNTTFQKFHTEDLAKIEVHDNDGDLVLYDVAHNELRIIEKARQLIAYPSWSPDGQYLYYSVSANNYQDVRYDEVQYDIVRRRFDAATLTFGEPEMILPAASLGMSATHPRISPDGHWLLVAMGRYGCFHLNHAESDLYLVDLNTSGPHNLTTSRPQDLTTSEPQDLTTSGPHNLGPANAPDAPESYHSWSSNGRWILFSSRRDDGNSTRLYITYFDPNSQSHKAFLLPQSDPYYERLNLCSYNVPEFILEPVRAMPAEIAKIVLSDPISPQVR